MSELAALAWPVSRVGEALERLGSRSGFALKPMGGPTPADGPLPAGNPQLDVWIGAVGAQGGLEVEPVEVSYPEVERLLRAAGPALLRLPQPGEPLVLALLAGGGRQARLLGPDLAIHRLPRHVLRAALCRPLEEPLANEVDRLLDEAGVPARRRAKARAAVLSQRLGAARIGGCWLVRLPPGAGFWSQLSCARLPRRLLELAGAHAVQYLLWLLSWWVIGRAALSGRLDRGWLLAWLLLLLTMVPFRLFVTWRQGLVALGAGALLKRRLLAGALRLEPEEIRHQGVGQLLGRVIESQALEALALSGGFLAVVAVIELALAATVLALGAGGAPHALMLLAWAGLAVALGASYFSRRRRWTGARLDMTHDLVERMVGHRTRLAQETPERWHEPEDQALARYLELSGAMDGAAALILSGVPRGWLLAGLAGIAPAFVAGASPGSLAVGLGGVLLAYGAFRRLASGVSHVAGAAIAWAQVAPLFHAADRPAMGALPPLALASETGLRAGAADVPVLDAHNLVFRHRDRAEPVLLDCSLRVGPGERLLLEGASGSGKSTLASVLGGLREPESGLLLLDGLDRPTLGETGWRGLTAFAPQFHENHVLAETFAFNLLMGRRWPASPEDLQEAEVVCRGLGLGDLLDRMPAGLLQMVGETGWQLSHGERSRLYAARALLQRAELTILDESFAALDPESLQRALGYVLERAQAVMVIAHP